MKVIHGDLLQLAEKGEFDVILHGCNCHCSMGAGIAKLIKQRFPAAYEADLETVAGDRSKLGTISYATVQCNKRPLTIVNCYTQFNFQGAGTLVDYDAVRSAMSDVKLEFKGLRIGYPKIGAGLARGDWKVIAEIIDIELNGEDHTLVEYEPN